MAITASKLDLVRHCPGSQALPQVDSKNEYQDAGNERDKEFTRRINEGDIPEEMAKRWPGAVWRTQVRFAYNWSSDTGRELPSGSHRDYSDADVTEIVGTADVVGELPGLIIVGDKKSFDPNVPRAAVNGQIHIAALAMCRFKEINRAEVFIDHEARAFDVAVIDDWDLAAFAKIAKRIVTESFAVRARHRAGESLQLAAGVWCRWCAAFDACPKQKELKAMVVSGEMPVSVEARIPLDDDKTAADLYDQMQLVGILHKRMKSAVYARAAERPIPLNGGGSLGPVTKLGNRELNGDLAYEVIRRLHGQAIADKAVAREATQKQIKEAIGKGDPGLKKVMDELDRVKGITRKTRTEIEEIPDAVNRLLAEAV